MHSLLVLCTFLASLYQFRSPLLYIQRVHRKQFLLNNIKEQYTPPASQQQQRKYSTNQQLSRLKNEPNQASKLLSHDNDDI